MGKLVDVPVYEVGNDNEDGGAADKNERYLSYIVAQNFLETQSNSLVLFDEVEDVLCGEGWGRLASVFGTRGAHDLSGRKSWINYLLDTNPVPTIWVCNRIDNIDPAFLRRFIYHLELPVPPTKIRRQIASKHLGGLNISLDCVNQIVQYDSLSPAQLRNAAKAAQLATPTTPQDVDSLVLRNVHNSMAALGQPRPRKQGDLVTDYNLDFLHIDSRYPVPKIVNAIARSAKGSLCLYGPPGTGKTQLAHHLAKTLEKPLVAKKGSDLLGKYVGESEKNIRIMFEDATSENAVLLLDEADTFLRNRQNARYFWEASLVNELLQQMEAFDGVFICATNSFDQLDPAALRRFSFKLEFRYLTLDQRIGLFFQEAGLYDIDEVSYFEDYLAKLDTLTPGDFATVKRQANLMNERLTTHDFLKALEEEVIAKNANTVRSRPIGFLR